MEEPLPAGGSCLLGSLNLSAFVKKGDLDYDSLAEAVFTATVALNEVLDEGLKLHPLKEQQQSVSDWRQIGLGIFGCADMLIKMGIRYGSEEAIELCRYISNFILNYSLLASTTLAMDKGTYKYYNYDYVSETPFYKENVWAETDSAIKRYGLRNSQLLTIAPTGSLSTMIGVSGGVEPIFANYYMRKTQSLHGEDVFYKVYTPIVKQYMEEHCPEIVIHCAALSNTWYCEQHPEESHKYNVQGTVKVAKACKRIGARLIFMSSDQVYNGIPSSGAKYTTNRACNCSTVVL